MLQERAYKVCILGLDRVDKMPIFYRIQCYTHFKEINYIKKLSITSVYKKNLHYSLIHLQKLACSVIATSV